MGKATRIRERTAREKIAAQRAAARRREIRNRMFLTGGSILGVVAIVAAFLIFKALNKTSASSTASAGTVLPASVIKNLTSVPAGTLDSIGAGQAYTKSVPALAAPALTSGGKPEVLYIGAEYCPYCAAERWAMVVALSRFGTFSGLHGIHSAPSPEVYPNTPTLTFYKSSYSSQYLRFSTVEEQTVTHATLQKPTAGQQALITKYDAPPYVSQQDTGAIPFVDFGGKYLVHGAQYNPQVLAGMTWARVAAALQDKNSTVARNVGGAANMITAAICKITDNQPSPVCTSAAVKSVQGQI